MADEFMKEIDPIILFRIEMIFREADKAPIIAAAHAALFIGFTLEKRLEISDPEDQKKVVDALFNIANLRSDRTIPKPT